MRSASGKIRIELQVPVALVADIERKASTEGLKRSEWIVAVLSGEVRTTERAIVHREIVLSPRMRGEEERFLDFLAARRPRVGDFQAAGGRMDPALARLLRKALTVAQARRLIAVLQGSSLESLAAQEGTSRQAVHKSCRQALARVREDAACMARLHHLLGEKDDGPEA